MRILKENTLALVIDVQEKLIPVMQGRDNLVKNIGILIDGLNELDVPLLVTQQYSKGIGETTGEIRGKIHDFRFIEKRAFSCCDEPVFMDELKKSGKSSVVICGIESHVCVLQTAVDLKEKGFCPIVVTDCISSRSIENIKIAKERYRYEGIMMATYESILFELTRTSAAAEFKAISGLVK